MKARDAATSTRPGGRAARAAWARLASARLAPARPWATRLRKARPRALLAAAAALHLFAAAAIYLTGRLRLLPGMFDADGVGRFADDGLKFLPRARQLVGLLRDEGWSAWWASPFEAHLKIYSLSFAAFEPLFGYSILSIEPLNLILYLAALCLVYRVGALAFGRRVGLVSAAAVAVWPSFLLHSTQFLKDPLFVAAALAVVAACVAPLAREMAAREGVLTGLAGAAALVLISRLKSNMWESALLVLGLGAALLCVRLARGRRLRAGNYLCAALLAAAALAAPVRETSVRAAGRRAAVAATETGGGRIDPLWAALGSRVASRREGFVNRWGGASSSIDSGVRFRDTGDVLRYAPRAAAVGLFAPFPVMWFDSSAGTGLAARLLSGAETLAFYAFAGLAAYAAWRERRSEPAWLLSTAAVANCVALGLVVNNVGALFRLRYVFWMLLIVLGVRGAELIRARRAAAGAGAGLAPGRDAGLIE